MKGRWNIVFLFFLFSLIVWVALPHLYPTVVCKFRGQIGNQLFQAATTLAYAKDHHCHPIFKSRSLLKTSHSQKNISYFFKNLKFDNLLAKLSYKIGPKEHFIEKNAREYAALPHNLGLYLEGYFQSEKYFAHHRDDLLKIFTPPKTILEEIQKKYGKLLKEDKVIALHVRTFIKDRNDESKIPQKWDYYQKALDTFPDDYLVMIFSDYPEYAKKHLQKGNKAFIFIEGSSFEYDFWLMNQCHHFIVAPDSTFSWWAAWLNTYPNKRVLCEGNNLLAPHYYPENWEVVNP